MVRLKIKIKLIWTKSKTELDWTELNCFKIALQPLFVCMSVKPMKMNHKKTKESHHLKERNACVVNLWIAIWERETNKQGSLRTKKKKVSLISSPLSSLNDLSLGIASLYVISVVFSFIITQICSRDFKIIAFQHSYQGRAIRLYVVVHGVMSTDL
jgi:hypothetical protein